jgi:hypothetical protein
MAITPKRTIERLKEIQTAAEESAGDILVGYEGTSRELSRGSLGTMKRRHLGRRFDA